MPAMVMSHDIDPREVLFEALGNQLEDFEAFNAEVLVAVYQRGGPKNEKDTKTAGGIIIPQKSIDEDKYQSKVGLIVKTGESAFNDPNGVWFKDVKFSIGDWVVYRPSDGWNVTVNKVLCRMLADTQIKARIQHPDTVW